MPLSYFDKAIYSIVSIVYLFAILSQRKTIFYALKFFLMILTTFRLIYVSKD